MQEQFVEEQRQTEGKGSGKGNRDVAAHEEGSIPHEDDSTN
jgi:hypothetical protein